NCLGVAGHPAARATSAGDRWEVTPAPILDVAECACEPRAGGGQREAGVWGGGCVPGAGVQTGHLSGGSQRSQQRSGLRNTGSPQVGEADRSVAFVEGDNDLDHARPRDQVEKVSTVAFAVAHVVVRLPVTTFFVSLAGLDIDGGCREGDSSSGQLVI